MMYPGNYGPFKELKKLILRHLSWQSFVTVWIRALQFRITHIYGAWKVNWHFLFLAQLIFFTLLSTEVVSSKILLSALKNWLERQRDPKYFLQRVYFKSIPYCRYLLINWCGDSFALNTLYGIKKPKSWMLKKGEFGGWLISWMERTPFEAIPIAAG